MTNFIALYRCHTITDARLIEVSADPTLVAHVTACLLREEGSNRGEHDPVSTVIEEGQQEALRLVQEEVEVAKTNEFHS